MTENVVNFNKRRKTKLKADKKAKADSNSVKFGRSKLQKTLDSKTEAAKVRLLDGHKIDR